MITELSAEAQAYVRRQVEQGKYASEAEVLEEGLRMLAERTEREEQADTLAAIREGVADAEAGRMYTVEEAKREIRSRHPYLRDDA